ncbi:alpha/beta-hydrolase [Obba rivulosa]|uniref:Alpha/beta-hydrolase n=1 Tax=Obba rivulosa TaxID=1052685 RepID=A0A8E2ASE6_9APHY|nr:alpha/beta-hydrolase [Obba rivulosa]
MAAQLVTSKVLKSADGMEIYADAVGNPSNPSIVFIHGFSLSSIVFDNVFADPKFSQNYYLVRYDTRGHGRSGKPEEEEAWQSERLAQDFDAVVTAFNLKVPFVAAWSLGCTNLTDILSFHPPSYVSGLILITGFPYTASVPLVATPFALSVIPPFTSTADTPLFQSTALAFVNGLTAPSTPLPHHTRQVLLGDVMVQPRVCCMRLLARTQDPKGFFEAGRAGLPLLIVDGLEDGIVQGPKMVEAVNAKEHLPGYEGWKNLEVAKIAGAGHMPYFEKPEEFREAVLRFVAKASPQKA